MDSFWASPRNPRVVIKKAFGVVFDSSGGTIVPQNVPVLRVEDGRSAVLY
jgi:hypothetical protein